MKFRCSKQDLDRQLQYVSRVVTVRHNTPVLSNVLLETDKNILRVSGTDLELAVTSYLPAEIEQEGTFTVPAKLLQEFVHQNPDDILEFNLESYELICTSPKVTGRLAGMDADEFPALPKVEAGKRLTLPLADLVNALKQVSIACAQDQSRPVLTGVYMSLEGEVATLAATDSFRLVERKIPIVEVQQPMTLLIPSRTVQEIVRIAPTLDGVTDVQLEITEQQLLVRMGQIELFSRLISGAFPKYAAIIPKTAVVVVDIATQELVQALRLSNIFSTSGVANVLVEIKEDGIVHLSSYGSQRGTAQHTLYAVVEEGFQPLKAAFNTKFLLDAVQTPGVAHLQLRFSGATAPLIVATEDTTYTQLVMPIRLDT